AAFLAHPAKFARAPQVLLRAKTHGRNAGRTEIATQTTVRRLRPLARRAARTLRPLFVALRARKPIWRARFLRCGRKVGCMAFDWLRVDGSARHRGVCQGRVSSGDGE